MASPIPHKRNLYTASKPSRRDNLIVNILINLKQDIVLGRVNLPEYSHFAGRSGKLTENS